MPATKKTSKNEKPSRTENSPASRLTKTKPAAISSGMARKSSDNSIGAIP